MFINIKGLVNWLELLQAKAMLLFLKSYLMVQTLSRGMDRGMDRGFQRIRFKSDLQPCMNQRIERSNLAFITCTKRLVCKTIFCSVEVYEKAIGVFFEKYHFYCFEAPPFWA